MEHLLSTFVSNLDYFFPSFLDYSRKTCDWSVWYNCAIENRGNLSFFGDRKLLLNAKVTQKIVLKVLKRCCQYEYGAVLCEMIILYIEILECGRCACAVQDSLTGGP